jgi:hypothetical protein
VSPISPKGSQTIVIRGSNFGSYRVTDVTTNWSVPAVGPFGGCQAGIFVSSWNDTEIVIEGFPSFQRGQDAFKVGDVIKIEVTNAQRGGPVAWYSIRVSPEGIRTPETPPSAAASAQPPQNATSVGQTLPAGTSVMVRMVDGVDSSKNKIGDPFLATLDSPLMIGDTVVAPKGADVYGKLTQAKAAGKISGGAELALEMTGIRVGGSIVPVDTTDYDAVIKGRGKQSAARIGGGAAVGAIIGGIVAGGKGAAIGAGAGAAAGTAVQLATHGQQIHIPSETLLEFKLQQPLTVPVAGTSVATNEAAPPSVEPSPSSASVAPNAPSDTDSTQQRSLFSSDKGLDTERWQASTPLLIAEAKKEGLRWVEPKLNFDQSGMTMSGVNGTYQITGLQSKESLTPPFKVRATVMGTIANGVPFALYIVSDDLHQSLRAEGNLNPHNGPYYGLSVTPEKGQGAKVTRDVSVNRWYTVEFAVDANGAGTATVSGSQGTGVLSKTDMPIGMGPFFVLLVQREGAPYTVGVNEAVWSSVELIPGAGSTPSSSTGAPSVVQATLREGGTSIELPSGQMYLYGMATGGGAATSEFAAGQYAKVLNTAGLLSAALAYGTNGKNSYSTQTAYHDIGGVSVAGSWKDFVAYYGSNHQTGAHDASVSFQTNEDSLVVVLGLASSQQFVSVEGLPNLQVDASRTGGGIVIAHANVGPGSYNVVEHSKVLAAGQDPAHMADLVGVFVFSGKQENKVSTPASEQPPAVRVSGASKGNIRSVDFQNFDYTTNCLSENDPALAVHVSNGQANTQDGQFWADKPVYGNFKGDSDELAAVALSCHPADMSPNVGFSEVLVFEMSESGPKVLAKLPPSFWKQARVKGLNVSNQQLAADFLEMGMGSNACPEWIVTSKLRWNGSSFVNAGESRRKNSCAR